MTTAAQLFAIFAFGLVMAGVVFLGLIRARDQAARAARERTAADDTRGGS